MHTVVTHSGKFHADDVFAVATLSLLLGDNEIAITRTRDPQLIEQADYVVDVGGIYDARKNRFDHHQEGGAGARPNGIPYAGFGLVWKHFGPDVCGSAQVAERIDAHLVQSIDALDNGVDVCTPLFDDVRIYSIQDLIFLGRPTWKEDESSFDDMFLRQVAFARGVITREMKVAEDALEAERSVVAAYTATEDKRLVVVDEEEKRFGRELLSDTLMQYPEPLFVVFQRGDDGRWEVGAINKSKLTFETRKPLPEAWGGKRDTELEAVTGVTGAVFCHNKRFMCVTENKEAALALAKLALEA